MPRSVRVARSRCSLASFRQRSGHFDRFFRPSAVGRVFGPPNIGTKRTGSVERVSTVPSRFCSTSEFLPARCTLDGKHHDASVDELLDERGRHLARRGGREMRSKRRVLGPAVVAVAGAHGDAV